MSAITKIFSTIVLVAISFNAASDEEDLAYRPMSATAIAEEQLLENTPRTISTNSKTDLGPLHHIACRAKEPNLVENIIKAVGEQDVDVVLYFHGGLSNQKYVVTDLGPALMTSVFSQAFVMPGLGEDPKQIKRTLYPIFMNYDAGVWDWDRYSIETQEVTRSKTYKIIRALLRKELVAADKENLSVEDDQAIEQNAAKLLYQIDSRKTLTFASYSEEEKMKYFLEILQSSKLPLAFSNKNNSAQIKLDILAKGFQDAENEYIESNQENFLNGKDTLKAGVQKGMFGMPISRLKVSRVLARIALGNHHGLDATLAEELFDSLGLDRLGELHWKKVKRHAEQCFAKDSNGRELVDKLIALQKAPERNRKIHTWSHSAGSIPTAELIHYLGKGLSNKKVLDQVQMVAPAINQKEFDALLLPHTNVFTHLKAYSLTQKAEREDELLYEAYPASLLYAVSSLAEDTYYLDKMLLIDQHMRANRRPYRYPSYQSRTNENSQGIWKYFLATPAGNGEFYLYPQGADTFHVDCKAFKKCGPSHEGTKLPWLSSDLTRHVLKGFDVINAGKLTFPKPTAVKKP